MVRKTRARARRRARHRRTRARGSEATRTERWSSASAPHSAIDVPARQPRWLIRARTEDARERDLPVRRLPPRLQPRRQSSRLTLVMPSVQRPPATPAPLPSDLLRRPPIDLDQRAQNTGPRLPLMPHQVPPFCLLDSRRQPSRRLDGQVIRGGFALSPQLARSGTHGRPSRIVALVSEHALQQEARSLLCSQPGTMRLVTRRRYACGLTSHPRTRSSTGLMRRQCQWQGQG